MWGRKKDKEKEKDKDKKGYKDTEVDLESSIKLLSRQHGSQLDRFTSGRKPTKGLTFVFNAVTFQIFWSEGKNTTILGSGWSSF